MNNEKKQKGKRIRFNIVDALLVLIILASGGALWYLLTQYGQTAQKEEGQISAQIEYRLTVSPLREEFRGKVNVGDRVLDAATGKVLGEVTDIGYENAPFTGTDLQSGEIVVSDYPGYLKMNMKVRTEADLTDGICTVGDEEILIGKRFVFRVPGLYAEGVCTYLAVTDAE